MEIGNRTFETPKMEVHQGLIAGAGVGTSIGAAKVLAPQLKDSFSKSIRAQKDTISQFKDSGKTIDEYIAPLKKKIDIIANPGSVQKTMNSIQEKGVEEKLNKFKAAYSDVVEGGTKKAYKDLEKTQKLIESGKPSKLAAIKSSVAEFAEKAKGKYNSLSANVKEGLKSTKGVKGKFKAVKDAVIKFANETPSVKKAGKLALAGAIIGAGAALIGKAVSSGEEE